MDFDIFEWDDKSKFHGVFRVLERDEGVLFSDAFEIHTLELPKLKRQPSKAEWSPLECWGLYLNNMEGEIMESIAEKEPMVRRAMTVEEIFIKNEEERRLYELREKGRRDYINAILTSENRGKEEGITIGIDTTLLIIGALKAQVPVDEIAMKYKLPVEQIVKIQSTLGR
jgi:predicted transposase/invertase (TIGR01784 family)